VREKGGETGVATRMRRMVQHKIFKRGREKAGDSSIAIAGELKLSQQIKKENSSTGVGKSWLGNGTNSPRS